MTPINKSPMPMISTSQTGTVTKVEKRQRTLPDD